MLTPQKEFDSKYITAGEILSTLDISRPTLEYARRTNKLPNPIVVNNGRLHIWLRSEITPYLDAWNTILSARRQSNS